MTQYCTELPTFQTGANADPPELLLQVALALGQPRTAHPAQVDAVWPPVDHLAAGEARAVRPGQTTSSWSV